MAFNQKNLFFFHEIVRYGSFSKASVKLQQSQPNLSRAMKALETDLNEILMIRSKKGIQLTARGKEILLLAKKQAAFTQELEQELKQSEPHLRVGASENIVLHLLPKILAQMENQAKISIFSGTSEQIETELSNLNIDMGIFFNPPTHPHLKKRVIGKVEFVMILPLNSKLTQWKEVKNIPFIGSRMQDYSQPYFAIDALQKKGLHPNQSIECNSQEAQINLVKAGLGYSLVPHFAVQNQKVKIITMEIFSPLYLVRQTHFTGQKMEAYQHIENELKKLLKT